MIVPQKLFIMKTRNSFFPANTVCLTDAVSDYDDAQHTIRLQVGLHITTTVLITYTEKSAVPYERADSMIDDLIRHMQRLCIRSSEHHV